jgi:hypothetical protein
MTRVVGNLTTQVFGNPSRSAAERGGKCRRKAFMTFAVNLPGLEVVLRSCSHERAWRYERRPPFSSSLVPWHRRFVRVSGQ